MKLEAVSTVNDPGMPGKTGDDRVGFDAAAGTVWVLDGATDVTDLRPFPACESGAAWIRRRPRRCASACRSRKQDSTGKIAG